MRHRCAELNAIAVIRLLNYLRRNPGKLSPAQASALRGDEAFLRDDKELVPVQGAENDGLLRESIAHHPALNKRTDSLLATEIDFDELPATKAGRSSDQAAQRRRIEELESQLMATQLAFSELRKRSMNEMDISAEDDANIKVPFQAERDDDTHYFASYAHNDIHQTMISDTARTLSYAKFILSPQNAHLFRGKRIMDVGCGSGILSLFAARAGAAEVIAIDASAVAERAERNIRENGFDGTIKVFRGKVEDLKKRLISYEGKIDVIISEWMGYFLLYESMLPSVLHARDLYMKPGGLMAPSHCRITFAGICDDELMRDRVHFWDNVHGFKMTAMAKGVFDEAYTEVLKKEVVVTDVATLLDLPLCVLPTKQPTFRSPFTIKVAKDGPIHGFVSWFDTWFMTSAEPYKREGDNAVQLADGEELDLPTCTTAELITEDVPALKLKGNEVAPEPSTPSNGEVVSFTTSPFGKATHWKQTVFLIKEPLEAKAGDIISGEVVVTEAESNSRELDAEVHYLLEQESSQSNRKTVQAKLVQLFKVR